MHPKVWCDAPSVRRPKQRSQRWRGDQGTGNHHPDHRRRLPGADLEREQTALSGIAASRIFSAAADQAMRSVRSTTVAGV